MSRLQRLTPKRIERLKGAVIKDVITEEEDNYPYGKYTRTVAIELCDGRHLTFNAFEITGDVVVEMCILPKQKGGSDAA